MDNDNDYNCIISVGMRCFTEIFLKKMKLKKFSCIFDGMYNINIDDIIYILEHKFNYDDLIYTEYIANDDIQNLNIKYGNRTLHKKINYKIDDMIYSYHNAFLPHHNLNNTNTRDHFDRCFNRIDNIKHNKIRTLFCLFIHPQYGTYNDVSDNDIETLNQYLIQHFNCKLLVCKFKEEEENDNKWRCIIHNETITYIHINNNSHLFTDNSIVLNEIMKFMNVDETKLLTYKDV
jgi:hypothetical protein